MTTKNPNPIPHWDVSNVYPGLDSPEFLADTQQLADTLTTLESYLDQNHIQQSPDGLSEKDPEILAAILDHLVEQINSLTELMWTLRAYINAFSATDSYNAEAKKAFSNWEGLYVRFQQSNNHKLIHDRRAANDGCSIVFIYLH